MRDDFLKKSRRERYEVRDDVAESKGFARPAGRVHLGLQGTPGALPSALGFESLTTTQKENQTEAQHSGFGLERKSDEAQTKKQPALNEPAVFEQSGICSDVAESKGFEPLWTCALTVFKI